MDEWMVDGDTRLGVRCGSKQAALCPRLVVAARRLPQSDSMTHLGCNPSPFTQPVAKARGSHLRVHFKHVREVVHTINGWPVAKAKQFLEDVLQYKRAVPFTRCVYGWIGLL